MRNEASPGPTTKVPTPWRVSTSPAACSLEIASRTTVRLTPNSAITAASVGSLWPGASAPSRMRSVSASTSSWARERGLLRAFNTVFMTSETPNGCALTVKARKTQIVVRQQTTDDKRGFPLKPVVTPWSFEHHAD